MSSDSAHFDGLDDEEQNMTDGHDPDADRDDFERDGEVYEAAGSDFESDIDTSNAAVPDHPVVVDVSGKGQASARLVKQRTIDGYLDDQGRPDLDDRDVVELLRRHYVSPESVANLTLAEYRDAPFGYYDPFLEAIMPELGNGRR